MKISQDKIKSILIINLGGIGDLLISIPALRGLRDLYPAAKISLFTVERPAELIERFFIIDKIFAWKGGWKELLVLSFKMRRKKFDLAINMRTIVSWASALKMAAVFWLIGPAIKAGRDTDGRGFFLDIKIPESYLATKPEAEYDNELVRQLGGQVSSRDLVLPIAQGDIDYIETSLKAQGVKEDDVLIGVNPGGIPSRRWPLENFAQVIRELCQRIKCKIVVTGSAGEKNLTKKLKGLVEGEILDFSGKTTVWQLAALIKRCKVYISNDTGPMHIAVAVGIPGVFIFGPGQPTRYRPYQNTERYVVLHKTVECAPCEKRCCKLLKCLKSITPEEVLGAVEKLLNSLK